MNKRAIMLAVSTLVALSAYAQFFIGLRGSPYAGITNVNFNPAIANSPFIADVNLLGIGATVNNNYMGVARKAILHPALFQSSEFKTAFLQERINGKAKQAYTGLQIQGPLSFMFSFGNRKNRNKNAVGFSYHVNSVFNADKVTEVFARTAFYGLGANSNNIIKYMKPTLENGSISVKSAVWIDYAITYSRVIYEKEDNLIKVGGTLKLLQPIAGAYSYINNISYKWTEFDQLTISNSEIKYAYSNGLISSRSGAGQPDNQDLNAYVKNAMKFKAGNPGLAVDLGAVYEWYPYKKRNEEMDCHCKTENSMRPYKIAAGFSIIDFGALQFKRSANSRNFNADIDNWDVTELKFPQGLQSFDDTISSRFQQQPGSKYFTIWLPTRFNLFIDYNIRKDFGLAFTAMIAPNMSPRQRMVHHITTFALTAKYENKWFGFYLPLSYDVLGNISLGSTLRLGPLTIGTQDLLGLFAKKYVYNADVHASLKITIPYFKTCKKGDLRFQKKT